MLILPVDCFYLIIQWWMAPGGSAKKKESVETFLFLVAEARLELTTFGL